MADAVRDVLQSMGVELSLLRHHGVFSEAEVREIVRRRTDFEYRLRRKPADRSDFDRYLRYEISLQRLRQRRVTRLGIRQKTIEYGGLRHIHFIFTRALRKFFGDLALWAQYIEFCVQSGAYGRLAETFSRALRLHPRAEGLWVLAAKWEYEHNCNMRNARALMQRALRINTGSRVLYTEYAKLELLYVEKLRERLALVKSAVSSADSADAAEDDKAEGASAAVDAPDAPDAPDESADALEAAVAKAEQEGEGEGASAVIDANSAFFRGEVARLVYVSALDKFPTDCALRVRFLRIFAAFEGTEAHQREICESLERDFPGSLDALQARASWAAIAGGASAAAAVYEAAIAAGKAPAERVWELYAEHARCAASLDLMSPAPFEAKNVAKAFAAICQRAHEAKQCSPSLYLAWMRALAFLGDEAAVARVAREAAKCHPASHELRLALEAAAPDALLEEVASGTRAELPAPIRVDIALRKAKAAVTNEAPVKDITRDVDVVCVSLPRAMAAQLRGLVASAVGEARGRDDARMAYQWALSWPATAELVRDCAKREAALGSMRAYDRGLRGTALGRTDTKLWLEWLAAERSAGNASAAAAVYRLAKTTLDDCSEFVEKAANI